MRYGVYEIQSLRAISHSGPQLASRCSGMTCWPFCPRDYIASGRGLALGHCWPGAIMTRMKTLISRRVAEYLTAPSTLLEVND